jgi:DNA repair photolyase
VSVNAMPILPGLTDSRDSLDALVRAAAQSGADSIHGNVLFLKPSAMAQFMPFLQEQFPELVSRYRKLYARSAYLKGEYKDHLAAMMAELRKKYGLEGRRQERPPAPSPQLTLW